MGQTIQIGETYLSSKYGRYITVLGIDKEDAQNYTLAILWVDKDTLETEAADLVVSKEDVNSWTMVEL